MNTETLQHLYSIAQQQQVKNDPAHDLEHVKRVIKGALRISNAECNRNINYPDRWPDDDIIEVAALFHDSVVYRKGTEESKNATEESALFAEKVLNDTDFPQNKIPSVMTCIRECSFSKGIIPSTLESKILADADMLESTGVFGIMRTFSYAGLTNVPFYNIDDPFCVNGAKKMRSGLDLFYDRLLLVENRMNTYMGKKLAERRTQFLRDFLQEFELEIEEIQPPSQL